MQAWIKEDETLDDLQLKGINIIQKKDAFRFGVDAVLLANYSKVRKGMRVIDLCTGTGIVPLILAGKTEASYITGIEIQGEMVEMAQRSVEYNKLTARIGFIHGDLKDIEMLKKLQKVDVVTVNPPYKLKNSGIVNPNDKNAIARHEILATLEDVIVAARVILKDNGKLYMVHSLKDCLVSSAATISAPFRTSRALKVISFKLPIGVGTRYSFPLSIQLSPSIYLIYFITIFAFVVINI